MGVPLHHNEPPSRQGDGRHKVLVSPECRARRIGIVKEFCECETEDSSGCEFRFPFGHATFCRHPRWAEIVKQTQK